MIPQEKIRPLTSLDHPQSPFYDPEGGAITPVARVLVERIARKVHREPYLLLSTSSQNKICLELFLCLTIYRARFTERGNLKSGAYLQGAWPS